jgi:hypothetical protein
LVRKNLLVLVDGRKKSTLDGDSSFERMEVSKDSGGSLKSLKKFTNPFRFGSTTLTSLGVELKM